MNIVKVGDLVNIGGALYRVRVFTSTAAARLVNDFEEITLLSNDLASMQYDDAFNFWRLPTPPGASPRPPGRTGPTALP